MAAAWSNGCRCASGSSYEPIAGPGGWRRSGSATLAPDRRRSGSASELAVPLLTTAWLAGTALLGVAARYEPLALTGTIAVYAALAIGLHQGALWLREVLGRAGSWLGAFLFASTLVWQLREQTVVPSSLLVTLLVAVTSTPVIFVLAVRPVPVRSWRPRLAVTLGAAVVLVVLLLAGAGAAETFRWHLLRHNTLLGTPFYYLVEPAVEEVQRALVADASRVPPPPAAAPTPAATAPEAPHLIFVLLDTLRADALAAWDGDPELMPLLNQRLESAVRLTNVQANASWTRPSMASYFTGLLPEEHGAVGVEDALADGFRTLAEELSDRGYRTVAFTTNIAATGRGAGFAQGFDTFVQLEGSPYARAERVRRALDAWLQEHEPAGPVFLYLHFLDPHEPYLAGEAPRRKRPAPYRRAYQRELRYLDRELDAILDRAESALPGPEILLVASDHGEELFEHELFGHGLSLYQEVLHVPVAVTVPGGRPGRSVAAPLEARDVHGLLLDLVADPTLDPAAWAHGHARDRRYASLDYSTTGRLILRPYLARVAMRAIQEGHEKLVWSAYGDTRELYDLKDDPGETRNLLAERPERAAALTRALGEAVGAWVERTPVVPSDAERQQLEALGYVE